ncbi:MAG: hypothetical protein JSR77_04320 [Planctomycetes bacterium]|nr:hypothetical protein [Planctomycetota bacterium]
MPPPESGGPTDPSHNPSPAEETIAQVFVSPRVVDQRAFDDLSSTLRTLVRDAASQSRVLLSTTGEVRALGDQLHAAIRDLDTRVTTAANLIPTIDKRVGKAEQLLAAARDEIGAKITEFRAVAGGIGEIDRAGVAARVREITQETIASVIAEQLVGFAQRLNEQTEAQAQKLAKAREDALAAVALAERTEARAAAAIADAQHEAERLDRAQAALREAAQSALDKSEALKIAADEAHAAVRAAREQLDDATEGITKKLDDCLTRVSPAISDIEARGNGLLDRLRTELAGITEHAAAIDIATADKAAADLNDAVGRATEAALDLRELTAGISQHREQSEAASRTFATMTSQAQSAGEEIGNRILSAAEMIESLSRTVSELEARLNAAASSAEKRIEHLGSASEDAATAREVGARLAQLVQRADALGAGLDRLLREAARRIENPPANG